MTGELQFTAAEFLAGIHRCYVPAKLGAVTRHDPVSGCAGLSFVTGEGEQRFLIGADDIRHAWELIGAGLAAYEREAVR